MVRPLFDVPDRDQIRSLVLRDQEERERALKKPLPEIAQEQDQSEQVASRLDPRTKPGPLTVALENVATRVGERATEIGYQALAESRADASKPFLEILGESMGDNTMDPINFLGAVGDYLKSRYASVAYTPEENEKAAELYQLKAAAARVRGSQTPMSAPAERFKADLEQRPDIEGLFGAGRAVKNFVQAFANDPAGGAAMMAEVSAESAPLMGLAVAASAVTKNPQIGAAFLGLSSGAVERYTAPLEFLASNGVEISDPAQLRAAVNNPKLMADARRYGVDRAAFVAFADWVSGIAAGQELYSKPLANFAAGAVTQAGISSAGEFGAQAYTKGLASVDWNDVTLEGLAEFATAPIEMVGVGRQYLDSKKAGLRTSLEEVILDAANGDPGAADTLRSYGFSEDEVTQMSNRRASQPVIDDTVQDVTPPEADPPAAFQDAQKELNDLTADLDEPDLPPAPVFDTKGVEPDISIVGKKVSILAGAGAGSVAEVIGVSNLGDGVYVRFPDGSVTFTNAGQFELQDPTPDGETTTADLPPLIREIAESAPPPPRDQIPDATAASQTPASPGKSAGLFLFDATSLGVDAERFQFKAGGDQEGVTNRLKGVKRWDPAKANQLMVWQSAEGELFVVDGHQRSGLARRLVEQGLEQEIKIPGLLYRETDGFTPEKMRALAAGKNLAEGSGTLLDAAKVLKVDPTLIDESMPVTDYKIRQATDLSKLSDEPFRMVINEVTDPEYGAIVGRLIPDSTDQQVAAISALNKIGPANAVEAELVVRRVLNSQLAEAAGSSQGGLFGDALDMPESTVVEEIKIVARAMAELKKDKAVFARVVKNADKIESVGSRINREASEGIVSESDRAIILLTTQSDTAGPVRTQLLELARDLKQGKVGAAAAARKLAETIRSQPAFKTRGGDDDIPLAAMRAKRRAPIDTGTLDLFAQGGQIAAQEAAQAVRGKAEQLTLDGMGPSARQLAASREAAGKGRLKSGREQADANQGLFADKPDDGGFDFMVARSSFTPEQQQLLDYLQRKPDIEEIANHPLLQSATAAQKARRPTFELPGYGGQEFEDNRVFNFNGEEVVGYGPAIDRLVEKAKSYSTDAPVLNNKQVIIILGPPAAGKSTLSETLAKTFGMAIADPDDAKLVIPEYDGGVGTNAVHEESSRLGKIVSARLISEGANFIIPTVGDNAVKLKDRIIGLKSAGYTVHLANLVVEPNEAFRRMVTRFLYTGRLVAVDYAKSIGTQPSTTYDAIEKEQVADGYTTYDGNGPYGVPAQIVGGSAPVFPRVVPLGRGQVLGPERSASPGAIPQKASSEVRGPQEGPSSFGDTEALIPRQPGVTLSGEPQRPATGIPDTGQAQEEVSVSAMAANFVRLLNLTFRTGRVTAGRDAIAQYNKKNGVIRARQRNDLSSLIHEGGHAFHDGRGVELDTLIRQNQNEITQVALRHYGAPQKLNGAQLKREGFAEFFRFYVTNPSLARQEAPAFYQAFDNLLKTSDPNMHKGLQALQRQVAYYTRQYPSTEVVKSFVKSARTKNLWDPRDLADVVAEESQNARPYEGKPTAGGFFDWIRRGMFGMSSQAYTGYIDQNNGVRKLTYALQNVADRNKRSVDLKDSESPFELLAKASNSFMPAQLALQYGVTPYKGTRPASPSLRDGLAVMMGASKGAAYFDMNEQRLADANAYLVALRAVEEYQRFAAGEIQNPPVGFSEADARQAIRDFETKYGQAFIDGAKLVHSYARALLDREFEAGLISPETYDDIKNRPSYVPLLRDMSDRNQEFGDNVMTSGKTALIKRFRGSSRDIIAPLDALMHRTFASEKRIAENETIKAMAKLAQKAGVGAGSLVERIPAAEVERIQIQMEDVFNKIIDDPNISPADAAVMQGIFQASFGGDEVMQIFRSTMLNERGERILTYRENGKLQAIQLGDDGIGESVFNVMRGLGHDKVPLLIDLASMPGRALRFGITKWADFLLINYFRDQFMAGVSTNVGYIPFASGAKGMWDVVRRKKAFLDYSNAMGIMGGVAEYQIHKARVAQDIDGLKQKGYVVETFEFDGFSYRTLAGLVKGTFRLSELSEAGTRVALFGKAYKRAIREGLSEYDAIQEASRIARDYIDFGRVGSKMAAANRLIPFLNANIQGLDVTIRKLGGGGAVGRKALAFMDENRTAPRLQAFVKTITAVTDGQRQGLNLTRVELNDLKNAQAMWVKMTGLALMSAAIAFAYKDDEDYQEASEYIRQTGWLIPLGDGRLFYAPKPFEIALLGNFMERAIEYAYGDEEALGKFWENFTGAVTPPFIPPIVSVGVGLGANLDISFGRPREVVPGYMERLPPEQRALETTTEVAKQIGQAVGYPPAKIDFLITSLFGSMGRDVSGALDSVINPDRAEKGVDDSFITRRFVRDATRGGMSSQDFNELSNRLNGSLTQASGGYKRYIDVGDERGGAEYLASLTPDERAWSILDRHFDAKFKRLHPVYRASQISTVVSGMRREVLSAKLKDTQNEGEFILLTAKQKRLVDDFITDFQRRERRNALIAYEHPSWKNKKPLEIEPTIELLREVSPETADELQARLEKAKIYDAAEVAAGWPELRQRLLDEGSEADLTDLLP